MNEHTNNQCLVLLPAGTAHYPRLFDELFASAIVRAGLVPYRIQENSAAPLPIDVLIREIAAADAIFADLSQSDLDIWFALGCALTLKKPLCLISSRLEFSLPIDIQDLDIIPYSAHPFPSDYKELEQNIVEQLSSIPLLSRQIEAEQSLRNDPAEAQSHLIATDIFTSSKDLTSYEVQALTAIDLKASENGLSPRELGLEMQMNECAHLTSHAINALKRRKLIESRPISMNDRAERYVSDNLFLTPSGEEWLIRHGKRKDQSHADSSAHDMFLAIR
jgi:hypothetical protein